MISRYYQVFALILVLTGFQTAFAQYTSKIVENEPEDVSVLYNNGEVSTGATSKSGVAAPTGYTWSECQNDTGNTTETNTVNGYGATFSVNHLADNFTIPAGQSWRISSVSVWGYFLGWTAPQSPFSGGILRIWNGRPGDTGSTVVFGDITTNRLLSSTEANIYVINNSSVPTPGTTPVTTRRLWENKLSVAPTLSLGAGTYWIEFATGTTANAAQFYRNVISLNNRTQAGWNARQYAVSTNVWADILDNGNPATAPDVPQDIAFKVNGTIASTNNASKFMDYDGDGKTDFGITRWGPVPSSPTEWWILRNNGSGVDYNYAQLGVRAAANRIFSGATILDKVLPEDYDGDGKADIAVYRDGSSVAQPASFFYIINSSNNTIRIEQFGTRLDNASIMGDYDGDGKADLIVYRDGATTGAQSFFWIKNSSNGEITTVAWGIRGDVPLVGDFDGDGKKDIVVSRRPLNGSESNAYILRSSDAQVEVKPIPFPDPFVVPGDYDGDGKTDIATIKSVNNSMVWTVNRSSDDITETISCGIFSTDFPAQGDYNGDGKTDFAVFRKTGTGTANPASFWVRQADGSFVVVPWGHGLDNSIASIRAY